MADERQRLEELLQRRRELQDSAPKQSRTSQVLAGIGDIFSGTEVGSTSAQIQDNLIRDNERNLSANQERITRAEADLKRSEQLAQEAEAKNPNSTSNVKARELFQAVSPRAAQRLQDAGVFETLTDEDLQAQFPKLAKQFEALDKKTDKQLEQDFKARQAELDRKNKLDLESAKGANARRLQAQKDAVTKNKPKDISSQQWQTASFAVRAEQVAPVIEQYAERMAKMPDLSGGKNVLRGKERQSFEAAVNDFTAALLRKESGAAIGEQEMADARKRYIPEFGDTPEVLAQKAKNRQTIMAGLQAEAGDKAVNEIRRRLNPAEITEEDIDTMSEEELDAFLAGE